MFCFNYQHYKRIAILETRLQIAEDQMDHYKGQIKEKDMKIAALIAETNELVANLMNMEQYVRQNTTNPVAPMPSQARDWARVAEAIEARAMLAEYDKNRG